MLLHLCTGLQSGSCHVGSPPLLPENLPCLPGGLHWGSHHPCCHWHGRKRSLHWLSSVSLFFLDTDFKFCGRMLVWCWQLASHVSTSLVHKASTVFVCLSLYCKWQMLQRPGNKTAVLHTILTSLTIRLVSFLMNGVYIYSTGMSHLTGLSLKIIM